MKAVFPGKPQAKLHSVSTCIWEGRRLVAYISGNTLLVLDGPNNLLQTISHGDHETLTAVAIHDATGKIATCTATTIYLYKPLDHDVEALRWSLDNTHHTTRSDPSISCLSWGLAEELLVGGACLTLFSTDQQPRESWSRPLANVAKYAALCPDASIIATTGWYDRLVKIWKRSWFGEYDERFDISYLPHPAVVTGMRWHGRQDAHHHTEAILYTTCADNKLRVWAHTDPHDLQTLQIWTEIDLMPCLNSTSLKRYVIIVDNWEFETLVEKTAQQGSENEIETRSFRSLMDISYRDPDICIILDDQGNMSAWGLERVGCKARPGEDFFNVTYDGKLDLRFAQDVHTEEDYLCSYSFGDSGKNNQLNLLFNFFDGRLEWMSCPISHAFRRANLSIGFKPEAIWTGHVDPIDKIVISDPDSALMSLSASGEIIQWSQNQQSLGVALFRNRPANVVNRDFHFSILYGSSRAVLLHDEHVSIWDFDGHVASELSQCYYRCEGNILDLFQIFDSSTESKSTMYVAICTTTGDGIIWEISHNVSGQISSLREFSKFQLDLAEDILAIHMSIDVRAGSCNSHACISTVSGNLMVMTVKLYAKEKRVEWIQVSVLSTNIKKSSLAVIGKDYKAVVIDSTGTMLSIWDIKDGHLEYTEQFESHENIRMIKWMTCGNQRSAFALSLPHRVLVYGQQRYDYLHHRPAWIRLKLLDVSHVTNLHVADFAWLQNSDLLVAAGHQMFVYGTDSEYPSLVLNELGLSAKLKHQQQHLNTVIAALSIELRVFHPANLVQCMAAGKIATVHRVLLALHKTLKFYTEGDDLESDLGLTDSIFSRDIISGHRNGIAHSYTSDDEEIVNLDETTAQALISKLSETKLPFMSNEDQAYLVTLIESVGFVEKHQRSADCFGIQYLLLLRTRSLRLDHANAIVDPLSWREISWAFHSSVQDILVDLTAKQYKGRMMWEDARDCGMFMWMTDTTALCAQFEVIARNEYSRTDTRNPIDCSLYYLALRKKTVLIGLWRMATWNREQAATQRLLSNNFDDPRWKTAALKNAYALLGRRRFEYAAAFFLLADHLKDAVGVLATQLGDLQLAIAVARVYEGDDGPVLKFLLKDRVLPQASRENNQWLAHWAFSMLKMTDSAMKCLIASPSAVLTLSPKDQPQQQSKSFLNSDPALLTLYRILRDRPKSLALRKYPTTVVEPVEEWKAVIKTARLYFRTGCGLLALETLRDHTFTSSSYPAPLISRPNDDLTSSGSSSTDGVTESANVDVDACDVDEKNSQVDDDREEDREEDKEEDKEEKVKVEMKMGLLDGEAKRKKDVEEPSAASIFDSFDF